MTATAGDAAGAVAGFAAGLGNEPKMVAVLFMANFLKSGKAYVAGANQRVWLNTRVNPELAPIWFCDGIYSHQ
jgi:hypothetical protein